MVFLTELPSTYKLAQKTLKGIVNEIENELFFKKSFVRGRIKEKL